MTGALAGLRRVGWLAVVVGSSLTAQSSGKGPSIPSPEEVSRFAEAARADLGIPGAAVGVVDGGQITLVRGFGRRDGAGNPVTAQTPFPIASVSKSFTSLVILQLDAEGRLAIDDPVIEYVPGFRMADAAHAQAVTLRHLMNHTSGFTAVDGNHLHGIAGDDPRAMGKAVDALGGAKPQAAPGSQFLYSNANYTVLGHVIETIEQKPLEDVLEARVFSKLGMANAYGHRPRKDVAAAAVAHTQWFGFAAEADPVPYRLMLAAGGVSASAEDLAKYLRALCTRDPRIVPATLSRSFDDPSFSGYAFGWHHTTLDGRRVILHDGFGPGFRAQVAILPGENRAALLLMNAAGILDGSLHLGAVHHALGLPPVPIEPSGGLVATLWGSLAMVLWFGWGCLVTLGRAFRLRHTPWSRPEALRWVLIVLPSVALAGGAYALLVFVPQSLGLNLGGTRAFFPDLAAILVATATIAVVWAVTLPFLLVKRPRASR